MRAKAKVFEGMPSDEGVVRSALVVRWFVADVLGKNETRALLGRCFTGDPHARGSFPIWVPAGSNYDEDELKDVVSEAVSHVIASRRPVLYKRTRHGGAEEAL